MTAWLETEAGDKIPLLGNCSIGRDRANTLVLPGNQVSRRHAMIHTQGKGEHWLVDLGSSNGVLVNGRRVKQPIELKDQDRLEIDTHTFIFRAEAEVTPMPTSGETTGYMTIKASKSSRTANLWLLVADIEKFTPLSQTMPGDQLAKLVGKWIFNCKEIIEKNGGSINKYLGDGYLAYWPSTETQPAAIAAAIAELKQLQASGSLPFRIIIHHGLVTVDHALSDDDELIGPEVNFVFRMEKVAGKANQRCVLSSTAAAQLKAFGEVTPQGEHELTGFTGAHPIFSY